jgi:hypothetical protein
MVGRFPACVDGAYGLLVDPVADHRFPLIDGDIACRR